MNEIKKEQIMKDAEVYWSPEEWKGQILEEMGELITAFNHFKRGRISEKDVISEMVDVEICLDYFKRRADKIGDQALFWEKERSDKVLKMKKKMDQGVK